VPQRDYLLRQIEKMGVILAGIRQRVVGGEPARALDELREVAGRIGVDLGVLEALAPESLLALLGEGNLERILPAVDLLLLKAEIEDAMEAPELSADSRAKARILVEHLQAAVAVDADPAVRARILDLAERLNGGRT
jgi:hypothetical protein